MTGIVRIDRPPVVTLPSAFGRCGPSLVPVTSLPPIRGGLLVPSDLAHPLRMGTKSRETHLRRLGTNGSRARG
jgi:hypothetical protein